MGPVRVDSRTTTLKAAQALLVATCAASYFATGCSTPGLNPVIVRVFRDSKLDSRRQLDKKLYAFTGQRMKSGRPIVVGTFDTDYEDGLRRLGDWKPQLIVLDSPDDLPKLELEATHTPTIRNACAPPRNCPAFVPTWVSGEQSEAAQLVLNAISQ